MFAITPRGTGKKVGMRRVQQGWSLAPSEFLVDIWEDRHVLAEDGISLRFKTLTEEQQEKVAVLKNEAKSKFIGYRESSTNIDGTTIIPQIDLDNYKTDLINEFNTAKTAIQAETDIPTIQNYFVSWPKNFS